MGLDYVLSPKQGSPSLTKSLTSSLMSSYLSAPTTTETTDLQIGLFHDYHGDGQQQSDEPSISDLILDIQGIDTDYKTTVNSESDGKYWARNISMGKRYQIVPRTDKFRYIALSNAEFRSINDYDYPVTSDEPSVDLGLMEGFLTLPFTVNLNPLYYVDLDPSGKLVDWMGGTKTYSHCRGTDCLLPSHTQTFAAAPGVVVDIRTVNYPVSDDACGNGTPCTATYIEISHDDIGHGYTFCDHMERIDVGIGQFVTRGEQIGSAGYKEGDTLSSSTAPNIQIHFQYNDMYDTKDPFRDLNYSKHPTWPRASSETLWTKDNDPQFPHT